MSVSTSSGVASSTGTVVPIGQVSFSSSSSSASVAFSIARPGVVDPTQPPTPVTTVGTVVFKSPEPAKPTQESLTQIPPPGTLPTESPPPVPAAPSPGSTESNPASNNANAPGRSASVASTPSSSRATGSTSSRPNTVAASSTSTGAGIKRKGPTTKKVVLVAMVVGTVVAEALVR